MTSSNSSNRYAAAAVHSHTVFDEAAMLARIGSDLRDLYGDVDRATLPRDLLRLASLIDGKRQKASEDASTA